MSRNLSGKREISSTTEPIYSSNRITNEKLKREATIQARQRALQEYRAETINSGYAQKDNNTYTKTERIDSNYNKIITRKINPQTLEVETTEKKERILPPNWDKIQQLEKQIRIIDKYADKFGIDRHFRMYNKTINDLNAELKKHNTPKYWVNSRSNASWKKEKPKTTKYIFKGKEYEYSIKGVPKEHQWETRLQHYNDWEKNQPIGYIEHEGYQMSIPVYKSVNDTHYYNDPIKQQNLIIPKKEETSIQKKDLTLDELRRQGFIEPAPERNKWQKIKDWSNKAYQTFRDDFSRDTGQTPQTVDNAFKFVGMLGSAFFDKKLATAFAIDILEDTSIVDRYQIRKIQAGAYDVLTIGDVITKQDKQDFANNGKFSDETKEKLRNLNGIQRAGYITGVGASAVTETISDIAENPYHFYALQRAFGVLGTIVPKGLSYGAGLINPKAGFLVEHGLRNLVKHGARYGIPTAFYFQDKASGEYTSDEALARAFGMYGMMRGFEAIGKYTNRSQQLKAERKLAKEKGTIKEFYQKIKKGNYWKDLEPEKQKLINKWYKNNKGKDSIDSYLKYVKEIRNIGNYNPETEKIFLDHIAKTPEQKSLLIKLLKKHGLYVTGSSAAGKQTADDLDLIARKSKLGEIPITIKGRTFRIRTPLYDFITSNPAKRGEAFFQDLKKAGFDVKGARVEKLKGYTGTGKEITDTSKLPFKTPIQTQGDDLEKFFKINKLKLPTKTDYVQDKPVKVINFKKLFSKEYIKSVYNTLHKTLSPAEANKRFNEMLQTSRKSKSMVNDKKIEIHTQEWMEAYPRFKGYEKDKETGLYKVTKKEQAFRKLSGIYADTRAEKDIPDLMRMLANKNTKFSSLSKNIKSNVHSPRLDSAHTVYDPHNEVNYLRYRGYKGYEPYKPYEAYKPSSKYKPYKPYEPYKPSSKYKPYKPYEPYSSYGDYTPYSSYTPYEPYAPYQPYKYTKYIPYAPTIPKPPSKPPIKKRIELKGKQEIGYKPIYEDPISKKIIKDEILRSLKSAKEKAKMIIDKTPIDKATIIRVQSPNVKNKSYSYGNSHKFHKVGNKLIEKRYYRYDAPLEKKSSGMNLMEFIKNK